MTALKMMAINAYFGNYAGDDWMTHKILFVGNIFKRKGLEYLIEAFWLLGDKYELKIVGDGPYRNRIERSARLHDIKCSFTGYLSPKEVRSEMKKADILVLPAVAGEGLPNVLLEAMSVGLPAVATAVAGIPDIVKNGRTGIIVPPEDSYRIVTALEGLRINPELRKRMSEACLEEVKKYSWSNVIKTLEKELKEVIDNEQNIQRC